MTIPRAIWRSCHPPIDAIRILRDQAGMRWSERLGPPESLLIFSQRNRAFVVLSVGMGVDVELQKIGGIENPPLTSREVEVLALLARGKSNAAVASDLGIALKTVLNHVNHVLAKVDIPPWAAPRVYLALWYSKELDRLQGN